MKALIITAHGSRSEIANEAIHNLSIAVYKLLSEKFSMIETAFLEFANPNIKEASHNLIRRGATQLFIYPLFLAPGNHVSRDIPNLIKELQQETQTCQFTLLPYLGVNDKLSEVISEHILQSISNAKHF